MEPATAGKQDPHLQQSSNASILEDRLCLRKGLVAPKVLRGRLLFPGSHSIRPGNERAIEIVLQSDMFLHWSQWSPLGKAEQGWQTTVGVAGSYIRIYELDKT